MNGRNLQRNLVSSREGDAPEGNVQGALPTQRSSSGARPTAGAALPLQDPGSQNKMERTRNETRAHSEGDSDSSLPSPMREQLLSSDQEASGEESDPRPPPGKPAVWIIKPHGQKVSVYWFVSLERE